MSRCLLRVKVIPGSFSCFFGIFFWKFQKLLPRKFRSGIFFPSTNSIFTHLRVGAQPSRRQSPDASITSNTQESRESSTTARLATLYQLQHRYHSLNRQSILAPTIQHVLPRYLSYSLVSVLYQAYNMTGSS